MVDYRIRVGVGVGVENWDGFLQDPISKYTSKRTSYEYKPLL